MPANQLIRTKAIVLRRTNYGEADKILQLLTPDHGKLGALAKGVRKNKSKLAGALELLLVSDVVLRKGRGDLYTATSAKAVQYFGNVLKDYDRLQAAYRYLADVSKAAEQIAEPEWFDLLQVAMQSLDDLSVDLSLIEVWYRLQLAKLLGQELNFSQDCNGQKLNANERYSFDTETMAFCQNSGGAYGQDEIKFLRLAQCNPPKALARVNCGSAVLQNAWQVAACAAGV